MNHKYLINFLKKYQHRHWTVGFSGGADSCALLVLLSSEELRSELDFSLEALHFEHGIRGEESVADARFCEEFCRARGIPLKLVELHVPQMREKDESLESAARRLRQETWQKWCRLDPSRVILLGHHADDCMENLFLRLGRGGNVSGIADPAMFTEIDGVPYLRPLLEIPKQELIEYLRQNGVDHWCVDRTNFDCSIPRNYIRQKLLKDFAECMPYGIKGLYHSLHALRADAACLDKLADEKFAMIAGTVESENRFWQELPEALLVRVLRRYWSDFAGKEIIPGHALLGRIETMLEDCGMESKTVEIATGINWTRKGDWWILRREDGESAALKWDYRHEKSICRKGCRFQVQEVMALPDWGEIGHDEIFFDAAQLPDELYLSDRREGALLFCADGRVRKVKQILMDAKLTVRERECQSFLENSQGEILWIPGIRQSNFAMCGDKTARILRFSVEKLKN